MRTFKTFFPALALLVASSAAFAQDVKIDNPWVRATVTGQKATGAFMTLTAQDGARLTNVSSPAAGLAEVHEMAMQGDVMKMRAVSELELPAGKAVELKPGGYHVMLLDLKAPLAADSTVPLTLTFKNAKGEERKAEISVPVRAVNAPAAGHGHKH